MTCHVPGLPSGCLSASPLSPDRGHPSASSAGGPPPRTAPRQESIRSAPASSSARPSHSPPSSCGISFPLCMRTSPTRHHWIIGLTNRGWLCCTRLLPARPVGYSPDTQQVAGTVFFFCVFFQSLCCICILRVGLCALGSTKTVRHLPGKRTNYLGRHLGVEGRKASPASLRSWP